MSATSQNHASPSVIHEFTLRPAANLSSIARESNSDSVPITERIQPQPELVDQNKAENHKITRGNLPHETHRDRKSWLWDWWLWEIAGIALSLSVTLAIVVILAMYDGHPLPKWPYSITLNAMVSVLATIAKVR